MTENINDPIEISIIIISYNTCDLIGTSLNSVINTNDSPKEVFVVDNASTDGSVEFIRTHYPSAHLISNKNNRGFAAANNQALHLSRGRYIFLLNPDAEFLPSSFQSLIAFMDTHPHIGLIGIKIINPDGTVQESYSHEYPGQKYAHHELSRLNGDIAWVLGAGMLIRSELMRQMGGFDESFFVYGEDQDLCLRIRKAGYQIGYIDTALMVHLSGQSERHSTSADVWRKKLIAEYTFYEKHYLPQTVRKITRSYMMKAFWRIMTLKLSAPFYQERRYFEEKFIKYQVIQHVLRHDILKEGLHRKGLV